MWDGLPLFEILRLRNWKLAESSESFLPNSQFQRAVNAQKKLLGKTMRKTISESLFRKS